jgi:iron complex transport system ATP-binding protein
VSLALEGISVDLGRRRIVSEVDLAVPDGSVVGLLGPNGSGKSTILKTLYRVHRPSAGRILLDGADLLALEHRAAARRLSVVAQESVVEFDFTCFEMVMIGRTPHQRALRREGPRDRQVVRAALDRVGCAHLAGRSFGTLSGGEQQRVLIARTLAQETDHLVLDEPTNHLDVRYQVEMLELVAGLGVTVLAAIHDLSLAALFCDVVYVLSGGRIVASGTPSAVLTTETIQAAFGAEVLVIEHPETGTPHLVPRRRTSDRRSVPFGP